MTRQLATQTQRPTPAALSRGGILQRQCESCGQHTIAGGACAECGRKKSGLQRKLIIGASNDPLEQEADLVADQVMAASAHPAVSGAPPRIQRFTGQVTEEMDTAPASVDRVLASSGHPLEPALQQDMGQRFRHDFSRVRVHSGGAAEQSAREVNANAYTAGHNIVFGAGQFAPGTHKGRRLIAHELTHVVQQSGADSARVDQNSKKGSLSPVSTTSTHVAAGTMPRVEGRARVGAIQREDDKALDEKAKKIIGAAKNTSKGIDERAIDAVNSIVKTYYDPTLVEKVDYDEKDPGLTTSPIGTGKDIKGRITVGKYFIENIDSFARRVLQVGHELQHVQQQRAGMGGPVKKNEREFLAFHWESTQPEKAATGKMPHFTRVSLIDEALRNYYCMPDADQKLHVNKKEELLKLRQTEEQASKKGHKDPPNKCEKTPPDQAAPSSGEPQKKPSEKTAVTQPPTQKIEEKKGIETAASVGVETETKRDEDKTTTEVAGKLSFELTLPITDKLKLDRVSLLKEAGVEASFSLKSSQPRPLTSLELEATIKVISLDFEKVKVPLGITDIGISGSTLAGTEYIPAKSQLVAKVGVAGEAESKFKRSEKSPFFVTIKGGIEKTYDKEGNADFKWTPLTWKTSVSFGGEF